jgi:hypothetical protein
MNHPREKFVLELEALADEVPAATRLKMFLKRALRNARFRAVKVSALPETPPGSTPDASGDASTADGAALRLPSPRRGPFRPLL